MKHTKIGPIWEDNKIREMLARFYEKGGDTPIRPLDEVTKNAPQRDAAQVRIEWYIPPRHRDNVLELCPDPVRKGESDFPNGRCECEGWKHYIPQNPTQELAFKAALRWTAAVERDEAPALVLTGPRGTGKSHLLYGAVRKLNERGIHAAASMWKPLTDLLRAAKSISGEEWANDARYKVERLTNARALGIDEVRPTAMTDFDPQEMAHLMTQAYANCQAVFLTSNWASEKLSELVSTASTSRLKEIQVVGADYRDTPNKPRAA